MENSTYLKKELIGLERYYLWRPAVNTLLTARIRGSFSSDQFQLALSKVAEKHPLVTSSISIDEKHTVWLATNEKNKLRSDVIDRKSDDEWIKNVLKESQYSFSLTGRPLVRILLLKSKDSSDIILNSHHMICDGMALTYLLKDILYYLDNSEKKVKPLSYPYPLSKADLPSSAYLGTRYKIMISIFNSLWKRKGIFFDKDDHSELLHAYWNKERKRRILTWELSESQTISLVDRCKREKVTINSTLVTAFFLAQKDTQGDYPPYLRNITIPVNTRSRLKSPPGEVIGTFISAFRLKPEINHKKPFWDQVRLIHNKIKTKLAGRNIFILPLQMMSLQPSLIDAMSFIKHGIIDDPLGKLFLKKTGEHTIVSGYDISNLGRFIFNDKNSSLKVEWIYGPFLFEDLYENQGP